MRPHPRPLRRPRRRPKRQGKGMVVHVLTRAAAAAAVPPRAVAPLEWVFDNSFWLDGRVPEATELCAAGRAALEPAERHALTAPPALIDDYTRPDDGRRAHTYRFSYSSSTLALSRELALELNARVCEATVTTFSAQRRTVAGDQPAGGAAAGPAAAEGAGGKGAGGEGAAAGGEAAAAAAVATGAAAATAAAAGGAAAMESGGEVAVPPVAADATPSDPSTAAPVAALEEALAASTLREPLYGGRWKQERSATAVETESEPPELD
eukprot:scaffold7454_cov60-Phaeocystis_antarctica.AAC.6